LPQTHNAQSIGKWLVPHPANYAGVLDFAKRKIAVGERLAFGIDVVQCDCAAKKKEEFTGLMGHMVPGNSFPQICVVSGMIISNVP